MNYLLLIELLVILVVGMLLGIQMYIREFNFRFFLNVLIVLAHFVFILFKV